LQLSSAQLLFLCLVGSFFYTYIFWIIFRPQGEAKFPPPPSSSFFVHGPTFFTHQNSSKHWTTSKVPYSFHCILFLLSIIVVIFFEK
jgi:hypothetical protein